MRGINLINQNNKAMAKTDIMAKIDIEAIISRLERDRQIAFKKWEYHRVNGRPNKAYCF